VKFEDIYKLVEVDLKIDRYNLVDEATRTPQILAKYLEIYRNEKITLHSLNSKFARMKKDKFEYYSGKASDEDYLERPLNIKILKQDLDTYIEADEDIITLTDKINIQKEKCFFLEKVLRGIEQREFSIKNAITMIKFDAGEIG
jgi:F420-0:gamma-glutamyl ligase-like protein